MAEQIFTGQGDPSKEPGPSSRIVLEHDIQFEVTKITSHKSDIKRIETEIKDRLSSNVGYLSADEKLKEAQKEKKDAKKQAFKSDEELTDLDLKLKSLKEDKKQRQMTLSDYLVEFKEMTGQSTVQLEQGELFDFEVYAKLKLS